GDITSSSKNNYDKVLTYRSHWCRLRLDLVSPWGRRGNQGGGESPVFSALLRSRRLIVAAVSVLALAVVVGACGTSNKKSSGGGGGSKSGAIGLLLPEIKTTR